MSRFFRILASLAVIVVAGCVLAWWLGLLAAGAAEEEPLLSLMLFGLTWLVVAGVLLVAVVATFPKVERVAVAAAVAAVAPILVAIVVSEKPREPVRGTATSESQDASTTRSRPSPEAREPQRKRRRRASRRPRRDPPPVTGCRSGDLEGTGIVASSASELKARCVGCDEARRVVQRFLRCSVRKTKSECRRVAGEVCRVTDSGNVGPPYNTFFYDVSCHPAALA